MKLPYKEVVLSELIDDSEKAFYRLPYFQFDADSNDPDSGFSYGITVADKDGKPVRLRVYSTLEQREKTRPLALIMDALKGADIPLSEVEAALTHYPSITIEDSKVILDDVSRSGCSGPHDFRCGVSA